MRAAAHQRQFLLYRVGGVNADVEQALAYPEQAELPAQVGALPQEVDQTGGRDEQLEESAAQRHDELPEEAEENVARFVKGQVDEV